MQSRLNIWFFLHVLFFVFAITSVFWLPWYYLALIFILLRIQDLIFGGCIFTKMEYGSWERRWTAEHIGHQLPHYLFPFLPLIIDWLFPALLVFISYLIK